MSGNGRHRMRRTDAARRTLDHVAALTAASLLRQRSADREGWGQRLSARAKILSVLPWLVAISFIHRPGALAIAAVVPIALAALSGLSLRDYLFRTWAFIPLFTAVISLPVALSLITPGEPLIPLWGDVSLTQEGAGVILTLVLRVGASVSWVLWVLFVTGWHRLAEGMRGLGLPRLVVFLLMLTLRFLDMQLTAVSETYFGRLSRPGFRMDRWSQARWSGDRIADLIHRTRHLAGSVDEGLRSRGWEGDPLARSVERLSPAERLGFILSAVLAAGLIGLGR